MKSRTIFRSGLIGAIIAALCCTTPILVITLGAIGLGAWVAHIDTVVLPALGLLIAMALFGWWRARREAACCPAPSAREER